MKSPLPPSLRDEVRFFWVGPPLSAYEILSLKSFLGAGARVILYAYDKNLAVPDGVELRDAAEVLPLDILNRYNSGNAKAWARHSDLFRYAMLEKFGGWYADLDVVCLADRLPQSEMYFGRASEARIYAGLLKFPKGAAVLKDLIGEANRLLPRAGTMAEDEARAMIGTPLLSRMLQSHGLDRFAAPTRDAYAIPFNEALAFFDPEQCESLHARLEGCTFTHLWNGAWAALRIPRDYGPPRGSLLDVLFARFGIDVPEQGRLNYESIASWAMEDCILEEYKRREGGAAFSASAVGDFLQALRREGWQPRDRLYRPRQPQNLPDETQSAHPQTVRTFWHGNAMPPYQQACLASFARRGHRVEVFTYQEDACFASGLHVCDAREILPEQQVLRPLAGGKLGIHANLFRYALLERLGGWWIDPDVMLMQPDLPDGDVYIAPPDVFRCTPVAVLKFPAGHPLMVEARAKVVALDDNPEAWDRAGAALLSELVRSCDILSQAEDGLGPISWLNVPDLFDPGKRDELNLTGHAARFLHLQDEVWRRAGIPSRLGPPEGSYLAELLERYGSVADFPARMTFDQVNRWVRHMYRAAGLER
ncbi:glycosyltransferase [[Pseudomonas] carboxydohydrogena]|uniref:Glycosyltransferase n=1 Tax=Afipia carboxydohydrogena TaxID=290 RepID=A0ABY8BKT4_AFICR|nr:glycosyltransferase [[Pseudomonas] carboxydohydrogena]WEF50620.1 glycosyltransferase [[Pseudomonas] carboxydohydrogena]